MRAVIMVLALMLGWMAHGGLIKGEDGGHLDVLEADGKVVRIARRPERVVSVYGSLVGVWYLSGGRLAGIPSVSTREILPEAAAGLPEVGMVTNPNAERVLMLKPDLVLLSSGVGSHRRLRLILEREGISSLMLNYENYSDFMDLLDLFSRINGGSDEGGKRVCAEVDKVIAEVKGRKEPRFLCLFASARRHQAELADANTAYMATMLGGRNVVEGRGVRTAVSLERLVMSDPDVIFFVMMGNEDKVRERMEKELMSDEIGGKLRAVKGGRLHFLPSGLFLYRPNERYPEAFRMLREFMYPECQGKE